MIPSRRRRGLRAVRRRDRSGHRWSECRHQPPPPPVPPPPPPVPPSVPPPVPPPVPPVSLGGLVGLVLSLLGLLALGRGEGLVVALARQDRCGREVVRRLRELTSSRRPPKPGGPGRRTTASGCSGSNRGCGALLRGEVAGTGAEVDAGRGCSVIDVLGVLHAVVVGVDRDGLPGAGDELHGADSAVVDRVLVDGAVVGVVDLGAAVIAVERDTVDARLGDAVSVQRVAVAATMVALDAANGCDEVPREVAGRVSACRAESRRGGMRRGLTTGCRWSTGSQRCRRDRRAGRCRRASPGRWPAGRMRSTGRRGRLRRHCRPRPLQRLMVERSSPCANQNCHRDQGAGLLPPSELACSHVFLPSNVQNRVTGCYSECGPSWK